MAEFDKYKEGLILQEIVTYEIKDGVYRKVTQTRSHITETRYEDAWKVQILSRES